MSITENLVLHLPLNQHTDEKVTPDTSGNNLTAQLMGNAQLVPDDTFGACISLDGTNSYIDCGKVYTSVPGCTVSIWFKPIKITGNEFVLFGKETAFKAIIVNRFFTFTWQLQNERYGGLSLEPGRWYHVAITYDGRTHCLFHNGIKIFEEVYNPPMVFLNQDNKLLLGASGKDSHFYFYNGKIAQFRLYNQILTSVDIQQIMQEDQTAMATFRQSHPIAFNLLNNQEESVLYIDEDPAGHSLDLNLENTSRQHIQLAATPQTEASEQMHHFTLHFRPGTLLEDSLNKIRLSEGSKWQMKLVKQPDRSVKIYLLATQPPKIEAGATHTIRFTGFRAAGDQGSRGTRIELRYQNMAYEGSSNFIRGQRLAHINIVNHQGKKNIPLHTGFHGSNIILNDAVDDNSGSKNTLILHLTNGLKPDLLNSLKSSIILKGKAAVKPTKFIISFDGKADGEHKDWALGTKSQVAAIQIQPAPIKLSDNKSINWTPAVGKPGDTFQLDQDFVMQAGATLEFNITNIKSSSPAGHTNLYLYYENIPGYWEGQFVEVIEKSPLIYRTNNAGFEQVGIGTTDPQALLDVNGDTRVKKLTIEGDLWLKSSNTVYVEHSVPNWYPQNAKLFEFKPNYKGDQYRGQMHIYAPSAYDGNYAYPALTIAGNYGAGGQIGINKTEPDATLHVGGSLKVDGVFNAPGIPSALFPNPIKSADGKTIQINNLDINAHYMYMIVVKLHNPNPVNFDYKLYFNNDKNDANYFTVYTQQFGGENRVYNKRAASFANAGSTAFHAFTIYVTKSSSGRIVAYGQGGFETPGTDAVWGFQIWHFYLTYTGTGNVTSLTLSAGENPQNVNNPNMKIGESSEVRIMKWF